MTDLRRAAQMVEDLQLLQVLEEEDDIQFQLLENGNLFLTIDLNFQKFTRFSGRERVETIKRSIREEFSEKVPIILSGIDDGIICTLASKE